MPTPDYSVTAPSGILYGGQAVPLPLWAQGAPLNEAIQIAGTSGAGGAGVNDFSGWCECPNGLMVIAAAGGHGGAADNRVVSFDPMVDAPSWTLRLAASAVPADNTAYYADGLPAARHTYAMHAYIAHLSRVMTFGVRFTRGAGGTYLANDGFNLATNTWDVAGTWPDVPTFGGGGRLDLSGNYWFLNCTRKATFSGGGIAYSQPLTSTAANGVRYPHALNTSTGEIVGLCWGDGQGGGTGVVATKQTGNVQVQVTFNSSAALTQFTADASADAGMTYDPVNNWYVWYSGEGATAGRFYKIVPNAGTVWDMEILAIAGTITTTDAGGMQNKFTYIPALGGILFLPAAAANMHFIRTAP